MTEAAYPRVAPRERARFVDVGLGVLAGFVGASLVLIPAFVALDRLGLPQLRPPVTDWWTFAVSASAVLLGASVAAATTAIALRAWTRRPAPFGPVLVCILVTGYIPLSTYDGVLGLRDAVALLLLVILVRAWAADSTAALDRSGSVALGIVLVAAAVTAGGYAVTHPLSIIGPVHGAGAVPAEQGVLLENAGRRQVEILAATTPVPVQFVRVVVERPELAGGGHTPVWLVPRCARGSSGYVTVDRLEVRLSHLGRERTQRLAIDPVRITCP